MKSTLLLLTLLIGSFAFGQEKETFSSPKEPEHLASDTSYIYKYVEVSPEFPGGVDAMRTFLSQNIVYPASAEKNDIQGLCFATFAVSSQGTISQIQIMKGVPECPECDAEVIRVLKIMPNWKPGQIDGKNVNSRYNVPVTFTLVGVKSSKSGRGAKKH